MFAHRPKRNKNVFASECVRKCVVCEFNETYLLHACGEFSTFHVLHTINNVSLQTELRIQYVHISFHAKIASRYARRHRAYDGNWLKLNINFSDVECTVE